MGPALYAVLSLRLQMCGLKLQINDSFYNVCTCSPSIHLFDYSFKVRLAGCCTSLHALDPDALLLQEEGAEGKIAAGARFGAY